MHILEISTLSTGLEKNMQKKNILKVPFDQILTQFSLSSFTVCLDHFWLFFVLALLCIMFKNWRKKVVAIVRTEV